MWKARSPVPYVARVEGCSELSAATFILSRSSQSKEVTPSSDITTALDAAGHQMWICSCAMQCGCKGEASRKRPSGYGMGFTLILLAGGKGDGNSSLKTLPSVFRFKGLLGLGFKIGDCQEHGIFRTFSCCLLRLSMMFYPFYTRSTQFHSSRKDNTRAIDPKT